MQVSYFPNGGFVVHKIDARGNHRISAWFDADGNCVDAERLIGNRSYHVDPRGPTWREVIAPIGRRYAKRHVIA